MQSLRNCQNVSRWGRWNVRNVVLRFDPPQPLHARCVGMQMQEDDTISITQRVVPAATARGVRMRIFSHSKTVSAGPTTSPLNHSTGTIDLFMATRWWWGLFRISSPSQQACGLSLYTASLWASLGTFVAVVSEQQKTAQFEHREPASRSTFIPKLSSLSWCNDARKIHDRAG